MAGARWAGDREDARIDRKIRLEVWRLRAATGTGVEPVVEVSFKKDDRAEAGASRAALGRLLQSRDGWLADDAGLKTELILDRYR